MVGCNPIQGAVFNVTAEIDFEYDYETPGSPGYILYQYLIFNSRSANGWFDGLLQSDDERDGLCSMFFGIAGHFEFGIEIDACFDCAFPCVGVG